MIDSDETLTSYLLGELNEPERTALEEKYFSDSELFDQVNRVESDLIDDYTRGRLSPQRRELFEQNYLTHPQRRARLRFGETLVTRLDEIKSEAVLTKAAHGTWWTRMIANVTHRPVLAFSAGLAIFLAAGIWFFIDASRLRRELDEIRAAQAQQERDLQGQLRDEKARSDQLEAELVRLRSQQLPSPSPPNEVSPVIASLVLTISGVRGGEAGPPPTLVIPSGTDKARFQLNLGDSEYQSYTAVLQSASGAQIYRREGLRAGSKSHPSLSFIVPANKFSAGDYLLTLRGVKNRESEDVSKSLFRVIKK